MRTYTSTRLRAMHQAHGVTEGQRCGDCKHHTQRTVYCRLMGGRGHYWNVGWKACGRFEARA